MPQLLEPSLAKSNRRRPPWRQRLVEAERGITHGFRGDSTLFFHLFVDTSLLAIGGVLDLSFVQWLIVGMAFTVVIAAELMQQALKSIVDELRALKPDGKWDRVLHLATASVSVAFAGGSVVVGFIYWQRVHEMLAL